MSDTVIIVNTIVGAIVTILMGVIAYGTLKLNLRAREATVKVEEVKVAAVEVKSVLKENTKTVGRKLDVIHGLVNSQMLAQKKLLAVTARAKAAITNSKADLEAAETAEEDYKHHEQAQEASDASMREEYLGDKIK